MHWLQFFWLPSALVAWPLFVCMPSKSFASIEVIYGGTMAEDYPRLMVLACATLCLVSFLAGFVYKWAVGRLLLHLERFRDEAEPPIAPAILRWLGAPDFWRVLWLLFQPILLAFVGWPMLLGATSGMPMGFTWLIVGAALPTVLFEVSLRGEDGWRTVLGNIPLGCALLVTAVVELSALVLLQPGGAESLASLAAVQQTNSLFLVATLVSAGLFTSMILPFWMAWVTGATKLEGPLVSVVQDVWSRAGLRAPHVMLWPTGNRSINAAVVSVLGMRSQYVTDRMVLTYSDLEVQLISLHEIAHCTRHHFLVRLVPATVAVPLMLLCLQTLEGTPLALSCIFIALFFVALIILTCRWTELDADRQAVRMAERILGMSAASAQLRYTQLLQRMYRENRIERTSWSHPSLEQRIAPYTQL